MFTNRDPWQEAANNIGGGLKFSKGRWTIDNEEIETGENGLRLCLLMETGVHGGLKWHNDRIIDRRLQRFALIAPSNEPLELDWSHYTSVQCIGMSGEYVEQPVTFSSTTWGRTRCLSVGNSPLVAERSALLTHLHTWVQAEKKRRQREH